MRAITLHYSFLVFLSSVCIQLPLWPTSIRRGSSTEIWNQKTSCCSRERSEWVKDAVKHPVMTNTPNPQQRGHILPVCVRVMWNKCRRLVSLTHVYPHQLSTALLHWIFNVENSILFVYLCSQEKLLRFSCSYLPLWASLYFVRYATNQIRLQQDTRKQRMLRKWGQTY